MLKVGITGGIGSGKSTVCQLFEIFGIPIFNADKVAKSLMQTDEELKKSIKIAFGLKSYFDNGQLNRKYISDIVFKNISELKTLNSLVHPAVFKSFALWIDKQKHHPYIIKEAALLFESDSYKLCDISILVTSPIELKIKRILLRDNITEFEVKLRMDKQFSDEKKQELANFLLVNDEVNPLIPQTVALHQHLLSIKSFS